MNSARYEYQKGVALWPIPFAYEDDSHIGVNLILQTGIERTLVQGRDYIVSEGAVIYVLPQGCALLIYNNAPAAPLARFQARRLEQAARPAMEEKENVAQTANLAADPFAIPLAQTETVAPDAAEVAQHQIVEAPAADPQVAVLAARLQALEDEKAQLLAMERAKAADAQIEEVTRAGENGIAAIELNANEALKQIDSVAKTAAAGAVMSVASATEQADNSAERANTAAENAGNAAQSAEERIARALANLESRITELEARMNQAATRSTSELALASNNAVAAMRAAATSIQAENERVTRLAGQAWPMQGSMTQAADLAARSIMALPEPLAYYPGRNSLFVMCNGFVLTLGVEFEEVGSGANASNTIRLLVPTNRGDKWNFITIPTNAAQAADDARKKAETAAGNAATSAARAETATRNIQEIADKALTQGTAQLNSINQQGQQAVSNVAIVRDNAKDEISSLVKTARTDAVITWQTAKGNLQKEGAAKSEALRKLWQQAESGIAAVRREAQAQAENASNNAGQKAAQAENMADKAQALAECAWRAAFQASLDRAMPGIASVPAYEDLAGRPSGIYLINPKLKQPLPFMGIFPVESLDAAIGYDGIFLVGAQPYPDAPALPDIPYPENPADAPEMLPEAAKGNWLPCGHNHN